MALTDAMLRNMSIRVIVNAAAAAALTASPPTIGEDAASPALSASAPAPKPATALAITAPSAIVSTRIIASGPTAEAP